MPIRRAKSKQPSRNAISKSFYRFFIDKKDRMRKEHDEIQSDINKAITKVSKKKLSESSNNYWKTLVSFIPKKLIQKVISFPTYKSDHGYKKDFLNECIKRHEGGNYLKKD